MDPSPPALPTKADLRARLREARREHVAALPPAVSALLLRRPPATLLARIPAGATIGLYAAHGSEAPTAGYSAWFFENGYRLALPWFAAREAPMRFRFWANPFVPDLLVPGPWRAVQPEDDGEDIVPSVVFVPLLGFTARGDRLGQGGGHYDRWLAAHPGVVAIGLAWDCQLLETLPHEPHDRRLDAVVTPTRLYERED